MDLELSAEQDLLRRTTGRFIETRLPLSGVRDRADFGHAPGREYQREAAGLGWFAFLAPEDLGGGSVSGLGLLDGAILAEERGRALQPGAFIDTNVTVAALAAGGSDEQCRKVIPSLVGGDGAASWALADPSGDWAAGAGIACRPDNEGYRLNGTKGLVVEAQSASWLLVAVEAPEGPTQLLTEVDAPGLTVEVLDGLDLTRQLCEVHFDDVRLGREAIVGVAGQAAGAISRQLDLACVLAVAESVGAMDYLFDLTVQYAKDRTAFGRPIGSFQAVKHQLADSSLLVEMSKAAAVGAARAVQGEDERASEAASMAKAFIGDAAVEVAHKCWQNFGGIAYTWDHDLHLYMRRMTTDASLYGSPEWHRERICQLEGI
jgi:alkylation response protein AidB-like acyl-CoA dehydrogenase